MECARGIGRALEHAAKTRAPKQGGGRPSDNYISRPLKTPRPEMAAGKEGGAQAEKKVSEEEMEARRSGA
jgi:hypothetical protein